MNKRLSTLILTGIVVASLSSCNDLGTEYSGTGTITFYDGSTELGSISGPSASLISDEDKTDISSYEVKEGYVFDKWYTESTLDNSIDINYYPYTDLDVFAKFLSYVTITLDPGDGAFEESDQTIFTGLQDTEIVEDFPTPAKDKSSFEYWYYIDGTDEVKFDTKFFPDEDLTLHAKYADWPFLSFVTNVPGYTIDPIQLEPDVEIPTDIIDLSQLNSRDDYDFRGWYTDPNFSSRFTFEKMPDEDTTIYAKFAQEHSINFVTNVPDYDIDPIIAFAGDSIEAPDVDADNMVIPNKYFDGWYEDSSFAGDPYSFVEMPDMDLTLYAKWTSDPIITLYDVDGTTVLATLTDMEPGKKVDLTAYNPDHGNDEFLKWVENSGAESKDIMDPTSYVIPSEDTNLYVVYRTNYLLTIDFEDVDGNPINSIDSYSEIWGSYSIEDPSSELESYLDIETSIDYKPIKYLDSSDNEINFPYAISSDETITAIIASRVTITLEDTLGNTLGSTSGYQTEQVVEGKVTYIDTNTGNYVVYGIDTNFSSSTYNYNFAYLKDDANQVQYVLSNKFPTEDLDLVLVFNPIEEQF